MTKSMKRIHKVVIKRMIDESPDASYLEQEDMGFEDRLRQYKQDLFCFIGIRAEAEYYLSTQANATTGEHGTFLMQTITSGGLWGIESDSGDYFKEIEQEQLSELRDQLEAIGFSKRAISAAFRDVVRQDA